MILGKTYSPELFLVILLVQRLSWLLSNELQYTVQCTAEGSRFEFCISHDDPGYLHALPCRNAV